MTSHELTELRAYEIKNGPIGPAYEQHALAAVVDQLAHVITAVLTPHVKDEDDLPEFVPYPRPEDMMQLED